MISILIFLVAIVLANLSIAYFGPAASPINAFLLIGLDLSLRDKIHEAWHGNGLWWKMVLLVAVGGAITYVLNRNAGMICVASIVAFTCAMLTDTIIYEGLIKKKKLLKMNASNIGSAMVDSVIFPWVAFGVFMPWIIVMQFLGKVVGGFVWSIILVKINNTKHHVATMSLN